MKNLSDIEKVPMEENAACEEHLLHIIGQGHCVIAEITKLSRNIPQTFVTMGSNIPKKYDKVFSNFEYFKNPSQIDKLISETKVSSKSPKTLKNIDENIANNHSGYITRFYSTLEAAYNFIQSLKE